jgi:mannosyltransferase
MPALGALALILAGAAALRLHHLNAESVWLDEAFSISIAHTTLSNIVVETGRDVHPPLHYFLLLFWDRWLGGSTWISRLLSVACSLGTIAAAYAVTARLRSRGIALMAGALLAVSVFQVEFAQEARMYALLALLATLSLYGFIRLFDSASPRWFVFYAVATTLMVYTHAYAAFVLAGQAVTLGFEALLRRGRSTTVLTRWVLAQIVVLAAFLPWLAIFTWQFSSVQRSFWIAEPEWSGLFGPFLTYTGSRTLLYAVGPLALAGAGRMARRSHEPSRSRPAPLLVVLPWLLAPIVLPLLLSRVSSPIFLPKYTIAASVPFAILAADGIAIVPWTVGRLAVLAGVLWLAVAPLEKYYGTIHKDNWRAAVPAVEQQAQPDDLLLFYPYFQQIPFDYYRQRTDTVERAFPLYTPPPPSDGWDRTMERAVGRHRRIWLIMLQGDSTRAPVVAQFQQRFVQRTHQMLQHVDVYLFERPDVPAPVTTPP